MVTLARLPSVPVHTKRIFGLPPELFVLGATAALCASVLLGFKFRPSRLLTRSLPAVFSAPEAAHLTPPFAGQGMNSGVRDAQNLGWKLVYCLRGGLGAGALDSYEELRLRRHRDRLQRRAQVAVHRRPRLAAARRRDRDPGNPIRDGAEPARHGDDAAAVHGHDGGKMGRVGPNTVKVGDCCRSGTALSVRVLYYDGAGEQVVSHLSAPDLSVAGDARGPYQVGKIGRVRVGILRAGPGRVAGGARRSGPERNCCSA